MKPRTTPASETSYNVAVNEADEKTKPYYRVFPINLTILKILRGLFGPNANGPAPARLDQSIVMLYVMAVIFLLLVLLVEAVRSYPALLQKPRRDPVVREPALELDEDVAAEQAPVLGGGADEDAVRVQGLRNVFGSARRDCKIAVRNVTLGIPRGETFELPGIDGAGKTMMLEMLTGDEFPSQGGAWLGGLAPSALPHRLIPLARRAAHRPRAPRAVRAHQGSAPARRRAGARGQRPRALARLGAFELKLPKSLPGTKTKACRSTFRQRAGA